MALSRAPVRGPPTPRGIFSRLNPATGTKRSGLSPAPNRFQLDLNEALAIFMDLAGRCGAPEPLVVKSPRESINDFSTDGPFLIYDDHTAGRTGDPSIEPQPAGGVANDSVNRTQRTKTSASLNNGQWMRKLRRTGRRK